MTSERNHREIPSSHAQLSALEEALLSDDRKRRWKAAETLTDIAVSEPEQIWDLIVRLASSSDKDLQEAVATCALEHILEHHFAEYFPRVEMLVKQGNKHFATTFRLCWKLGQAEVPENAEKWERLAKQSRVAPRG